MQKKITFSFFFLLLILITSCENTSQKTSKNGKLKIVCTTGMIGDAAQNVVGDLADVHALMGVGVDPHLYKATPSDLENLSSADIIFYNGLHLEGKMVTIFEKLANRKTVIPVSEHIGKGALRQLSHNVVDPHIWFDVNLWQKAVVRILEQVKISDPSNAAAYQKNADAYLEKLKELDTQVRNDIAKIPADQKVLITSHDAFGYFGRAYAIEVRGLQGISTVSEAGLKDITDLVNFIVDKKLKAVFVETSVSQKDIRSVLVGCQEKGLDLKIGGELYGDAMGEANTPEGTYIGMVKANVETIVESLR
jgi:manganese/zinc/iron transport system substrate-binding protein